MAGSQRTADTASRSVTIYVTATVASVFRLARTLKEYQKWPEHGKLGRYYSIPKDEAQRVLEAAQQACGKVHKSDAGKRRGMSCFLSNTQSALENQASEFALRKFLRLATSSKSLEKLGADADESDELN